MRITSPQEITYLCHRCEIVSLLHPFRVQFVTVLPMSTKIPSKLPHNLGTYTLVRQVSKSSMSMVYEGRREAIAGVSARVAIKILHPDLADNETHKHLFIQEAKNASALMHRNIVHTQDFEEVDGLLMLVMEYVEGLTAREMMRQARQHGLSIPPHVIAEVGRQICDGLQHAHSASDTQGRAMGLVHCDVKPGNIILNNHGAVKVLDFGVSKTVFERQKKGVLRGTWGYMAPEQVSQGNVVPRTDLYALAIVLYEMATAKPMYNRKEKKDPDKIRLLMQGDEPIRRVMKLGDSYKRLQDVLIRALQRDPAARFTSAEEMGQELTKLVRDPVVAQQDMIALLMELQRSRKKKGMMSPMREHDQTDFSGIAFRPSNRKPVAPVPEKDRKKFALLFLLLFPLILVGSLFGLKQVFFPSTEVTPVPAQVEPVEVDKEPELDIIDVNPGDGEFEEMPKPAPKPKRKRTPKKVQDVDDARITPPKQTVVKPTKKVDDALPAKITISADQSAKVFVDGKLLGMAPIIKRQISSGKHSVQLAPVSGGIKDIKKFTIDVTPGKSLIYQWSFSDERWLRKGE